MTPPKAKPFHQKFGKKLKFYIPAVGSVGGGLLVEAELVTQKFLTFLLQQDY